MNSKKITITISGPYASGKTTLAEAISYMLSGFPKVTLRDPDLPRAHDGNTFFHDRMNSIKDHEFEIVTEQTSGVWAEAAACNTREELEQYIASHKK